MAIRIEDNSEGFIGPNGRVVPSTDIGGDLLTPNHAVPNSASGRIIYDRMRKSHAKRALVFARIQGMIDGNPPYSKKSLKQHGMLAQSNVNWRDGEAIYESVALAYWSLFNDVQYIVQFMTNIGDPNQNPVIGETVAKEFDRVMREWDKFHDLMTDHQSDLIKFGFSSIIWPDEKDWRFNVADVWRFLVPERTRNHTDYINIAAVEHVMSAQELWDIANKINDKNEDSSPWSKDEIANILSFALNKDTKNQYSRQTFAQLQTKIRNNDVQIDEILNEDILLVSLYIREYNGRVSHGIIHAEMEHGQSNEWVFFEDRQYSTMSEAVAIFSFTPGEKYVHGNKGMGHRIFNTVEGVTQLDNSLMDSARRASTVLIRSRSGRNRDMKKIRFHHGGFVDIGEAEFVQNLMGANLASSVEAARYYRNKLETNNNVSGANMATRDGKQTTLGETKIQVTREARVQKNRIAHYYKQLDRLFREIIRKMLKSRPGDSGYDVVKLWKDRCIEQGVPEEFFELTTENEGQNGLPSHLRVLVTRASGSGSQVADQVETQTMMQILPTLGERGRQRVLEDFVAANRGHPYIDRYLPPEDQQQQPVGDDTIASIENNQLEKGELVIVSPDNNHAVHAQRHLNRLKQIAEAFNGAEDQARNAGSETPSVDAGQFGQYSLEETDIAFQTAGPHFVRHLLFLQQDPTRVPLANSLAQQWAILANFGDKIANNAQEHRNKKLRDARKQQQELESLSMEERIENRKIEVEANIKMAKLRADIQRAANRDQLEFLLQRTKVSFDNELKRSKAISEISIDQAKANQKRAQEQATGRGANELF